MCATSCWATTWVTALGGHSLGMAVIVVTGWRRLLRLSIHSPKLNSCLKFLFWSMLLVLGTKTVFRNRVWSSRVTLFE